MNILLEYQQQCQSYNIPYQLMPDFRSYDETTLFCPSGMQQFKKQFSDLSFNNQTFSNVQPCLRLNDLDEIGDGTHLLYFNMIGLFSFRHMTVKQTIDFFMKFLTNINCFPDYITIHPDKINTWSSFYEEYGVEIRSDNSNTWSDGNIGGYCTEFYKNNVEIGNIVNPLDTCIDVGFGYERLDNIVNRTIPLTSDQILEQTVTKIIELGYRPSNLKHGYILRKLLRMMYIKGLNLQHPFFDEEIKRQSVIVEKYNRLKDRFSDKPKEWWYSTHGINIDEL